MPGMTLKCLCLALATRLVLGDYTTADGSKCNTAVPSNPIYLDPNSTIQDRANDLLEYMCWQEKVAQLTGIGGLLLANNTYNESLYDELAAIHQGSICAHNPLF